MQEPIRLTEPGVYFFRKPAKISVRLNKNALVLFYHPKLEGCGLVLHEASHSIKKMEEKLELLLSRTKTHLSGDDKRITAKLFGISYYQEILVLLSYQWLKQNKIEITAQDIGRNVRRNLLIDCGTGNVGIRYAENYSSRDSISQEAN